MKWAGLFGAGGEKQTYGFEPDISLHNVPAHRNDELIAIHHPSGTMLEADILFNLPPTEQYSRAGGVPAWYRYLMCSGASMSPGGYLHQHLASGLFQDQEAARQQLKPIFEAKWDRIVPCHGEVIMSGGRKMWDEVWGKYAPSPAVE